MKKILPLLLLIAIFSLSCTTITYQEHASNFRKNTMGYRWERNAHGLKRISIDIQTRVEEINIVDKEILIKMAEGEFIRRGIEIVDHTTMVTDPKKGDGICFLHVPRYGGAPTVAGLYVLDEVIVDGDPADLYWFKASEQNLETMPPRGLIGINERYQILVQDVAERIASAIYIGKTTIVKP